MQCESPLVFRHDHVAACLGEELGVALPISLYLRSNCGGVSWTRECFFGDLGASVGPRVLTFIPVLRAGADAGSPVQLYDFVWNRFRMVQSDYSIQGYNAVVGLVSGAAIVAHERMAR